MASKASSAKTVCSASVRRIDESLADKAGDDNEAWSHHALEAPEIDESGQINWELMWLYRRKSGVKQPRPIFAGDVFENVAVIGEDDPVSVVILQHPCALLDKNNELREVLLTARLIDHAEVTPSGWGGNYDVMPIVVHESNPLKHQAVTLDHLALVRSADLDLNKRVACMEINGITLLLQRWTNVNTRVVVPSWRFEQVINAQFTEVEGMESWCTQRQQARVKMPQAIKEATEWLDERNEDTGKPRRDLLKDPNYRKGLVRRMYEVANEMTQRDNEERARLKAERAAQADVDATGASQPADDATGSPSINPDETMERSVSPP